ncbi:signal peptidase II [Halobacillus naozhouensis]|uniref:signal peptidase II n=1 Tax=Halobacillus naozhouensis TaxID=554880 RepID=UPI0036355415
MLRADLRFFAKSQKPLLVYLGFALLISGALGSLINRIYLGYVVDLFFSVSGQRCSISLIFKSVQA